MATPRVNTIHKHDTQGTQIAIDTAYNNCLFAIGALNAIARILDADDVSCSLKLDEAEKDGFAYLLRLIADATLNNLVTLQPSLEEHSHE